MITVKDVIPQDLSECERRELSGSYSERLFYKKIMRK